MMVDYMLLEYLLVFYEEGSLLKASEKLCISQPSLSKGMQKLEEQLGINIFNRTPNKISLNSNGEKMLPYIQDIVKMNKRLLEKAKEIKESENTLSIGFTAPGPLYKFSSLLINSVEKYKLITKIDNDDSLVKGILNNTYDLVFVNDSIKMDGVICKKVMTEKLYISIPGTHFLAYMKNGIHWKDIDGQSFLLYSNTGIWENILKKNLKKSRFLHSMDAKELKEIVEYSSIPSFLTDVTIKANGVEGRINIPILDDDAIITFYAVCKDTNKRLLNLLK